MCVKYKPIIIDRFYKRWKPFAVQVTVKVHNVLLYNCAKTYLQSAAIAEHYIRSGPSQLAVHIVLSNFE